MSGTSLGIAETRRQLSRLPGSRAKNANLVYDHLLRVDRLRIAPCLIGAICGLVALVVTFACAIVFGPIANATLALITGVCWIGGSAWVGVYFAKKAKYDPAIRVCRALMYREFPADSANFRQILADVEQFDPSLVRRVRQYLSE